MNLTIAKGHHLYRFVSLTPSNFGTAYGHSFVDAPTQTDSQYGIPFIPDSAIKGVVKSHMEINKGKEKASLYFGTPDNFEPEKEEKDLKNKEQFQFGKSGKLVFGNADLISFPFQFPDGRKVNFLVLENMLAAQDFFTGTHWSDSLNKSISSLLKYPPRVGLLHGVVSAIHDFQDLSPIKIPDSEELKTLALALIGEDKFLEHPVVLSDFQTATLLWEKGAEIRALTQINNNSVAEEKSLRTVQLIPPGSVFISLMSNYYAEDIVLKINAPIQLGAWENIGCGWFEIQPVGECREHSHPENLESVFKMENLSETQIMKRACSEIENFSGGEQAAKRLKAIIAKFGPQMHMYGIEAALAFELAKAKPFRKKSGPETYAHRWFLAQLLNLKQPPPTANEEYEELKQYNRNNWFELPFSKKEILRITKTWQWLKKYSELGL